MLRVRLLGEVALMHDDASVALESPRLQSLVGLLVLRRDAPQDRARLAFELWPDSTESQARTNLRHLVHDLRSALPQASEIIEVTNRTLQWRPRVPVWVDVEVFETGVRWAADADDETAARSALETAMEAYGGDLLPNSWDDWVLADRERLKMGAIAALERLAGLVAEGAEDRAARALWDRLVRLDPVNETGYRGLMRSYARAGDRGSALRVYHACVSALDRDIGVPPSAETTEVYESLVRGDVGGERSGTAAAATSALVGRDREWAEVIGAWRNALSSGPLVLVVAGEPGIGKTRIVEELARACEAEGGAVARARAYAAGGRLPFRPVSEWLRSDAVAAHVARLAPVWRSDLARLIPEVGDEPVGVEDSADPALRRRLLDAIGQGVSLGRPLLLVLDDLQWADVDTIDTIHHLAHLTGPCPLLLAATVRTEELGTDHPAVGLLGELRQDGRLTEIALERLDRQGTVELVQRLVGNDDDPERDERLWGETAGNPLFVVEAVRAGVSSGAGGLTTSVQSMILSRLNALSEPARRVAELAATSGQEFSLDVLTAASSTDQDSVLDALDELWHRRIVHEHGAGYDFTHDRLREVAYLAVSPVRRRRLHRAVADAIEAVHGNDSSLTTELAQHRERAGQFLEAIAAHRAAAQHALTMFATDEAMTSLGKAMALLEQIAPSARRDELELSVRLDLGALMVARFGYGATSVREMFERARSLSRRLGRPPAPALLRGMAIAANVTSQFSKAWDLGEELMATAPGDPVARVEAHYVLGVSAFWLGDLPSASHHLEQAVAFHRDELTPVHLACFSQDPLPVCLIRHAQTEWYRGHGDDAWRLYRAALSRLDEVPHPYTCEYVLSYAAWVALEAGDNDELRCIIERGRSVWRHEGFFQPAVAILEGWLAIGEDRPDGIRLLEEGLRGWSTGERNLHRTWVLSLMARAHLRHGASTEAGEAVTAALEWAAAHEQRYIEADLLRLGGEVRATGGDLDGAAELFRRSQALARQQGAGWLERKAVDAIAASAARNG